MTPSEKHNALAREFIELVGRETKSVGELMVVVESILVGSMLLLERKHGMSRANAPRMLEAAIDYARARYEESKK